MSQIDDVLIRVLVNGQPYGTCVEAEVTSAAGLKAGSFRLGLAVDGFSIASDLLSNLTLSSATDDIQVEVFFGIAASGTGLIAWTSELLGIVDHISFDPGRALIELEGRDQMSRLIRAPTVQDFVNQTSSEIVTKLAVAAGLNVQADPTTTIVGQYYQLEHSRSALEAFSRFTTSLDIISHLAQLEGFDCFTKQHTLFFQVRENVFARSSTIDVANLGSPGSLSLTRFRLDRRTAFDRGANITLKSWNCRQRSTVDVMYSPSSSADAADFVFVSPNLLHDAASQRAQTLHHDIMRHALVVSGEIVGGTGLDVRTGLTVLNSFGWDGTYVIDSLTKHVSARSGLTQTFVAYSQ